MVVVGVLGCGFAFAFVDDDAGAADDAGDDDEEGWVAIAGDDCF